MKPRQGQKVLKLQELDKRLGRISRATEDIVSAEKQTANDQSGRTDASVANRMIRRCDVKGE
jgi:hypothetical protein